MRRKRFTLEEHHIRQIETMAGIGMTNEKIALVLGTNEESLREAMIKYGDAARLAIERGRALGEKSVQQTAYQMATSGNHPAMTIFWLKVRSRWSHAPETIVNQYNVQQTLNSQPQKRVITEQDRNALLDAVIKLRNNPEDASCKSILNSLQQSQQQRVQSSPQRLVTESSGKKSQDSK